MKTTTKYVEQSGHRGQSEEPNATRMRAWDFKMPIWILTLSFLLLCLEVINTSATPDCEWPSSAAHWKIGYHLRVYKQRRSEANARRLCERWGEETGKTVSFTTFYASGQKGIESHSTGACGYGFFLRSRGRNVGEHPFSICQVSAKSQCARAEQSRILPFEREIPACASTNARHNFEVLDWEQDPNTKWTIDNTGHGLEMKVFPPGSVRTKVRIAGQEDYLRVTKILLKWGRHNREGSEHSIGEHKRAGEIQIFHERHDRIGGKHALSFFIRERNNPQNAAWKHFLHDIVTRCSIIGSTHDHTSPPNIRNLLGEDRTLYNEVRLSYRLRDYIRYDGPSSDASCEDYTWTVYENAVFLSRSQFTKLRRNLKQFTREASSTLNFNPSIQNFCQHKGINR